MSSSSNSPSTSDLLKRINELEAALAKARAEQENLQRYAQLFNKMQHEVHIWQLVYDADNRIKTWRLLDANDMALKSWQKRRHDVLGKLTDDIFQTDATRQFMPIVSKIFSENKAYSWESYFEGTGQYLGMTSIPCDGYFISVGVDISDTKKTEKHYRDTVLQLQEAIAAGNVGLWDWDLRTNQTLFSPEWKAQLGYKPHEIADNFDEWQKRVHPEDLQRALKEVEITLDAGRSSHELEFRMRHKDGSYRWILAHASLVRDELGNPVRMVGSHIDITKQKSMEETMLQQQKMQALGTLAGGIAHDFNNLLTPMLGYAELLRLSLEGHEKEMGYIIQLEKSATRARELVQQILLISRKPSKSVAKIEPVYLDKALDEVMALFKGSLRQNIKVTLDVEQDLPAIGANAADIHRVILNICTNAIQSMADGGELIIRLGLARARVAAGHKEEETDCLCLQVSDTGSGMDKATQKRIFDPFFTTKDKGEERGTGLGLAIVATVMKQHGGRIEVASKPGKGTCFTLYFPIIPAGYSGAPAQESMDDNDSIQGILLVEDEADLCQLGHTLLSKLGYRVTAMQSAKEALAHALAHRHDYQLVITDYAMPEMSGVELLSQLRKQGVHTPVLVMTGFTNMVTEENRIKWGCQGLISKPYTIPELKRAIAAISDGRTPK